MWATLLIFLSFLSTPKPPIHLEIHPKIQAYHGISGICWQKDQLFWAIPERQRILLPLTLQHHTFQLAGEPQALPELKGLDTEAIACNKDTLVIGTENSNNNPTEEILFFKTQPLAFQKRLELNYRDWHIRPQNNHGIEGLCSINNHLLVSIEANQRIQNKHVAPLGYYNESTNTWTPLWLQLTSSTGKISDLTCSLDAKQESLEVYAIERHFKVARLIRFKVPLKVPAQSTLTTEMVYDLAEVFQDIPNFEGITKWQEKMILISDNHYGFITGPTVAIMLDIN